MKIALLLLLATFNKIESKISITVNSNSGFPDSYSAYHTGEDIVPVSDDDITSFFSNPTLYPAIKMYDGRTPNDAYYRRPTPWGDLYSSYGWAPVTKKIKVEYIRKKGSNQMQAVTQTQDFENPSSSSITVNTGLTQTLHNSVTSSWWEGSSSMRSSSFGVDLNVLVGSFSGSSTFSTSAYSGRHEVASEEVTVGSAQGVETVLRPGQSVRAELSVTTGYLELEVGYKMYLRGLVAVNYNPTHNGHHFYGYDVRAIMQAAGIPNIKRFKQTIRIAYHIDAKLKVTDK